MVQTKVAGGPCPGLLRDPAPSPGGAVPRALQPWKWPQRFLCPGVGDSADAPSSPDQRGPWRRLPPESGPALNGMAARAGDRYRHSSPGGSPGPARASWGRGWGRPHPPGAVSGDWPGLAGQRGSPSTAGVMGPGPGDPQGRAQRPLSVRVSAGGSGSAQGAVGAEAPSPGPRSPGRPRESPPAPPACPSTSLPVPFAADLHLC